MIAEKRNDDGTVDERRYVPEGGTRDDWNDEVRETLRKYESARKELDARLHEESKLPNLRAEIDGLKWAIEERDELIRDMYLQLNNAYDAKELDGFIERMRDMGIGTGVER